MLAGTWGFVTWQDVTSDIVQGQKATFYFMPAEPAQGWAGNAQRIEVKSFRAGRVSSSRDGSARIYMEYLPRGARKVRVGVERTRPSLVVVEGWDHPLPPEGWIGDGSRSRAAKWHLFAPEWRTEMNAFLTEYLRGHPSVHVLADFRDVAMFQSPGQPSQRHDWDLAFPDPDGGPPDNASDSSGRAAARTVNPPDESHLNEVFTEGAVEAAVLNVYERNPKARRKCVEHYGSTCFICGFAPVWLLIVAAVYDRRFSPSTPSALAERRYKRHGFFLSSSTISKSASTTSPSLPPAGFASAPASGCGPAPGPGPGAAPAPDFSRTFA